MSNYRDYYKQNTDYLSVSEQVKLIELLQIHCFKTVFVLKGFHHSQRKNQKTDPTRNRKLEKAFLYSKAVVFIQELIYTYPCFIQA